MPIIIIIITVIIKMKVSRATGVPWVSSAGPIVILLLLVGSGQMRITRWLYYVICKQIEDRILVLYKENTSVLEGLWTV